VKTGIQETLKNTGYTLRGTPPVCETVS